MMKQEKYQQIIARKVAQLVHLVLDSKEGEGEQEQEQVHHVEYDKCLKYGIYMLANYKRPRSSYDGVLRNMADFVDRFHMEQLDELGETIKMLGQVVVDDQHCPEDLKYSVLEFMLSVNYKAFRTALVNSSEIMLRRSNLLESLATAYKQREEVLNSAVRDYKPTSVRRVLDLDYDVSTDSSQSESLSISLASSLDSFNETVGSTVEHHLGGDEESLLLDRLDDQNDQEIRRCLSISLNQLKREQTDNDNVLDPCTLSPFAVSFAQHLHRPLQDVKLALLQFGEDGFLLRELLRMFFHPSNCRYFEMADQLIQLRPTANQLLQQFCRPLQQMQLLQLFIYCHGNHLGIFSSLTSAFRRLLKPVVESLTYFEQHVASGKVQATLYSLLHATKYSFQRLQLLWNLAVSCYALHPESQRVAAHFRSHQIICKLLKLTEKSVDPETDALRSSAAALLLHVLQVHCQFLDSWWQLGEFQDWHDEFAAKRIEGKESSEYVLRELQSGEFTDKVCRLQLIIEQHIKSAGLSLAVLYDSKHLGDFVEIHHSLLKKSLHHALVKFMLQQLKPYQLRPVRKVLIAPDIFKQLKSTENSERRSLYYAYYKESLMNFKQPMICGIDELLKQCQACVSYTPFNDLICQCFERALEPRVLLVNTFVVHLLRVELQLDKVLTHLRSVFLLFNFRLCEEQFGLALKQLQLDLLPAAIRQLQGIFNSQNPRQGNSFRVALVSARLDEISLHYNCEPGVNSIITESQLKLYNIAFRRMLQLYVVIRKLQQLPKLPLDSAAVATLLEFKQKLELTLERHLKAKQLQKAGDQCDAELQLALSLQQLQQVHIAFVQQMCCILMNNNDANLQDLIRLPTILAKFWARLQRMFNQSSKCGKSDEFESRYVKLNKSYLLSINRISKAMQCLLDWPKANGE